MVNINMKQNKYLTTSQLAKLLGISRVAVFKKIKSGEIKAEKIGRNYAIGKDQLDVILGKVLTNKQKQLLDKGIKKTVKEYGRTLELLGKE